jgi:hypothetical protein
MKSLIVSISAGGFFGSMWMSHQIIPIAGPLLWAFILWGFYAIYTELQKKRAIAEAAARIEPLFIVGRHPETDEPIYTLTDKLERLCLHVPYRRVMAEAQRQVDILTASGNGFMSQKDEADRLPVVTLFPFDGANVNETWEEYAQRVTDTIKQVRAQWHGRMEQHREHYLKYHHQQEVFTTK